MKYCNQCGASTVIKIPHRDNLPRAVCESCGFIQYENPRVIVGCIPEWEDKILLCKRAIEPRLGYWTLPAGFLENNETSQEGALRETLEEANAEATIIDAFSLIDIPHINQIYLLYRAQLTNANFSSTFESSEVALFDETTLPWNEIAFAAIKKSLERYFDDKRKNIFSLHVETINVSTQKK
ncbi:MAG: NUDIX hydrolase [Proteobacteria bacterium]|nr:NUDIX hydrolase [Pseudomonadota bacterium]MDA1332449.1 NUDIX hydrolase [Pseudomonadota bacterium]